ALSYFFEEEDLKKDNIGTAKDGKVMRIDMGRSAFGFLLQKNLVSTRLNHTALFSITANDIDHFPVLTDADPYYFPTKYRYVSSGNGYTQAEVDAFSALQDNAKFLEKSYWQFLKIVLTPDDVFKKTLADHVEEPELTELTAHFVARKQALRAALLQSHQFKKTWRQWSCQLFDINSDYLLFCTQLLKQEFEESITALSVISLQGANAFHACYQTCFEKKIIAEEDIIALIQQAESVFFSLKDDEKCAYAVHALKKNVAQLKQHCLLDEKSLSSRALKISDDAFVEVPSLSEDALVKGIVTWMTDDKNKATVLYLFHQTCDRYAAENASYLSYAASYIGSYFFGCQQTYRPVTEFKKFSHEMMEAKESNALCIAVSRLLCETGDDAKMVHRYFMKMLVERYSAEFSRSHIFKQMKQHPGFAYYLQSQPKQQLPEDRVLSLVPLLIQALEPDSQPLLGIGDEEEWMSVSHNTALRFHESVQAALPAHPEHPEQITQATSTCQLDALPSPSMH
ncbi:MAG TPA: hypothetical protein VI844_00365, partial [Coxiellaceae bacterium]|nr:hypothetical protein [Coxiellaceae bacterium]